MVISLHDRQDFGPVMLLNFETAVFSCTSLMRVYAFGTSRQESA